MFGVPAGNQQLGEDTREADLISLTMAALRLKSATGNNQTDVITTTEEVCQDNSVIVITLEEVSWHDSPQDCWIILYDNVYDITNFLDQVNIFFLIIVAFRPLFSVIPFNHIKRIITY